ncbi:Conserved oligomeric Golgi complex subunit 8-like [Oopsacas minuta]|uniref:Conserved oligomeric Golgi complex subunit 8 n=1 Tax=Oopsacas minuta TaxID=111878 RepID=A0AAV7JVF6_9METZ|nr:Conserved oligomeric Golgi complex subunit 8-like [Oopsacas minuta]
MPIVKRSIEPIYVSRNKLPKDTKLELECTSTLTLAGVILQLSSLSKHAETLFGELFTEASDLGVRFGKMKDRMENLNSRMEKMNPEGDEEVGAHEITLKKFRSRQNAKQQILSRATLPPTLQLESISSWLMPDKPTSWHVEPDYISYLQELASYSLSQMQEEPERLRQDRAQLDADTQNLAYQNYRTFILTADCSSDILTQFDGVNFHLDSIMDRSTTVKRLCSEFVQRSAEVDEKRQKNSLVLTKHSELLEVLEIPQVMETCVRNGYYEEALELSHHVQRLSSRLNHIPIMQGIARDVSNTMELMQSQLLQLLGTNIQLPACLKTIGYLRRMGVFEEGELRIKFLQTRNCWLQQTLSAIPSDDPYTYLGKLIETSRVHLFDIITQYRGIFPNDDPSIVMTSSEYTHESKRSYAHVFYGWITCKVGEFLRALEKMLSSHYIQRLDSLLSQSMYFGLSFSRIGADFRPMLVNIFHRTLFKTLSGHINSASADLRDSMKNYILTLPYQASQPPAAYFQPSRDSGKTLAPPQSLLQFTPLARYLNQLLATFNEVKQCPLISLALPFRYALQCSISDMVQTIREFDVRERSSYSEKEKELFVQFCYLTIYDLIPYLSSALLLIFPIDIVNEFLSRTPCVMSAGEDFTPEKKNRVYVPLKSEELGEPLRELYVEEIHQKFRELGRLSQQSLETIPVHSSLPAASPGEAIPSQVKHEDTHTQSEHITELTNPVESTPDNDST